MNACHTCPDNYWQGCYNLYPFHNDLGPTSPLILSPIYPSPKLPSAFETAEHLFHYVFHYYGFPEDIVSDRGPQFTSRVWTAFFRLLNVNISLTSGYHPQSNGQTECLNQELTKFLRMYCQQNQADWSRFLPWAEYAQTSIFKPSTKLTPFQCILGFQPPLFPWSGEPSDVPAVNDWFQCSEAVWDQAHVHQQCAINRGKEQADHHRCPSPNYVPGQWMWLSTRDLCLRLPCKKLSPSGPRVEEEGGDAGPSPMIVDGEEAFLVRDLLDSRCW
ncbi:uncharacterized protein LOC127419376 [Myxocyprinus asiaticus]|uniref:uncharacterized protein LOC127419376 n=1 Tax=Myxocyprinus asiaticus TaxID=70543 RepID=UPI0022217B82|nr:uncharacterized protein LOC127419376 [Myxocyprinus asiaticus]